MIPNMPQYIAWIFALTTLLTLTLFAGVISKSENPETRKKAPVFIVIALLWLSLQAVFALKGIYSTHPEGFPPKFLLFGMLPAVLLIVSTFATAKGRRFADSLPLNRLIYINVVRILVELVLWDLYRHHAVPKLMTFEGRNFDILAGITAIPVAYFGFAKRKIKTSLLLVWNIAALLLVLNIVINALLSSPTPLQRFAFDQPNIAILYFPFNWLPAFVVPVVIFGHIASIRQLARKEPEQMGSPGKKPFAFI